MAGVDVGSSSAAGRRKKGAKKKKRRVAIRIDMTPMVDVAFLLLTFFMLTTVFRKPQTMEINLPPKDVKVEMAESNLLTLRIDEKNTVYWNYGIEIPKKMSMNNLHDFLIGAAQKKPKLAVLVKIDRKSKYHVMIDILDELNQDALTRFSLAPMNEIDQKEMSKAS